MHAELSVGLGAMRFDRAEPDAEASSNLFVAHPSRSKCETLRCRLVRSTTMAQPSVRVVIAAPIAAHSLHSARASISARSAKFF